MCYVKAVQPAPTGRAAAADKPVFCIAVVTYSSIGIHTTIKACFNKSYLSEPLIIKMLDIFRKICVDFSLYLTTAAATITEIIDKK